MLFSFADLTDEYQLQTELEAAKRMETVGHLAGSIAHEFNNLLSGVMGNLEIAEALESQASATRAVAQAKNSATRAIELVRDMLSYSQRDWLQLEPVEVHGWLQNIVNETAPDEGAKITIDVPNSLPPIKIDRRKMTQVVSQLLNNAMDAMPKGGAIKITVKTSTDSDGKPSMEILVSDSGHGMNIDVSERIFEPFFTTRKGKQGLGLSMSHGIVGQHGGELTCASAEGKGTQMRILLPVGEVDRKMPGESSASSGLNPILSKDSQIMVIDDDPRVRLVTVAILKRGGHKVVEFESGSTALDYFAEHQRQVSLIVLDLRMPEMMGTEVLEQLRKRFEYVPVIICSGYLRDLEALDGNIHPDALLEKPVAAAQLLQTVEETLVLSG